jgi:hypothetical protein
MKRTFIFLIISFFGLTNILSQKIIFLHHSTGQGVYNDGNVATWISNYNTAHSTNYQISDRWYPSDPYPYADDNYSYDYWNLWINGQCNNSSVYSECLGSLTQNYNIIIYKHCYPGSDIDADEATPSVSSSARTLANYKLQYRALRNLFDSYPNNKFIIWTLAPRHRLATTTERAARAKAFVDWVKNQFLTEDGKSHPNIYIFDFWGNVAETSATPTQGVVNCLKYSYEKYHTGDSDSHPNTLANQTVGPIFAQFIVNVINNTVTTQKVLDQKKIKLIYSGSDQITVNGLQEKDFPCNLNVFSITGRKLLQTTINQPINSVKLEKGCYVINLYKDNQILKTEKIIVAD